jgi:riboflavin kinase/FMN adenylyltransferase
VKVRFVERIRGEEQFDSIEALVEQMHRDVEATRAVLADRA